MGLFQRMAQVIKANLNDLISKAEDPKKNVGTNNNRYARTVR